jgi:hypothetical protein
MTIFLALCMAGEMFLLYALVHFQAELREDHAAHVPVTIFGEHAPRGEKAGVGIVIPITERVRTMYPYETERKAS